MKGQKD